MDNSRICHCRCFMSKSYGKQKLRAAIQRMKLQSDIGHFPSICGTCPNKNRYVLPNCPNDECAHACERACIIAAQSLDARLAHGYTASKCPSRYPVMKRSRSYCQTVTWLYRQTVSQATLPPGTRDRIAPPISGTFCASLSFAWLAVHWQTLRDHDGHLLAV